MWCDATDETDGCCEKGLVKAIHPHPRATLGSESRRTVKKPTEVGFKDFPNKKILREINTFLKNSKRQTVSAHRHGLVKALPAPRMTHVRSLRASRALHPSLQLETQENASELIVIVLVLIAQELGKILL